MVMAMFPVVAIIFNFKHLSILCLFENSSPIPRPFPWVPSTDTFVYALLNQEKDMERGEERGVSNPVLGKKSDEFLSFFLFLKILFVIVCIVQLKNISSHAAQVVIK